MCAINTFPVAIAYHRPFAEMETELLKKSWVVNHQRPTAETKVVEEYLSRYICRIGISSKRLHYDKGGKNVRIEYNDYANQEQGKAAPKKHRDLPPLVAMHLFLQHQLPPYFQRVRHSSPAEALAKEGWPTLGGNLCKAERQNTG